MGQNIIVTPWQKVYAKFGMSQSEFARVIGRDRSKISRALRDPSGLISGQDQRLILKAARECNVSVAPEDMIPVV